MAKKCVIAVAVVAVVALVVGLVVGLVVVPNQADVCDPSEDLRELFDQYFEWRMEDMPQFATFVGFHDYNDRLDNLTIPAYEERLRRSEEFLQRTLQLEQTACDPDDLSNIVVLKDDLNTFIGGYDFNNFLLVLNNLEGPQLDFDRLISWMPANTSEDYNKILQRMSELPTQIDQMIELMKLGVENKITYHENSMNRVEGQIGLLVLAEGQPPEEHPYYVNHFASLPASVNATEQRRLQEEAAPVMSEISAAYSKLSAFIHEDYPTRPDMAVTSLPNGDALYQTLIMFHTGTNASAEYIHEQGKLELEKIEDEMLEIAKRLCPEMGDAVTVQKCTDQIRDDPNNYYTEEEDLLEEFEYLVYDVITPKLPMLFKNIPEAEVKVEPNAESTGAFYLTGSYDGSRPGVFYVGTMDVSAQPKYEMRTLSLHEANPGHHLQGSYALEDEDIVFFRSTMDDRNYGHSPSRFPIRSYYAEGWALYAETLGVELDVLDEDLDLYGHLGAAQFRAARLVVDTGLHAMGWGWQESVDYLLEHSTSAEEDLKNEVDRYVTWPGQALSYKTGELQLQGLRADAEAALGDQFELKEFHDIVLRSVGPLSLVEQQVQLWVQEVLAG